MFENQGDSGMRNKNYDVAITYYSAALSITPARLQATLFVKRSEARTVSCLLDDALKDADEVRALPAVVVLLSNLTICVKQAIRLDPSSPWGYERKHAALHKLKRYGDAIDALTTMISTLENSVDPEIRREFILIVDNCPLILVRADLRGKYVNPSDTKNAILEVFRKIAHDSPFRLLDTTSGLLCDAEKRRAIFIGDPIFQELVSSVTTQLQWEQIQLEHIDAVTREYFQYVMLSHRWETEELKLADVLGKSIYKLDASPSATKLQQFCYLARDAKFRWAWSDTCCIDKDRDVEFEKSINSMFQWYHGSAATMVYLTGVPPQMIPYALKESVWMKRGWTLQELLAPPILRFYYEDWTPYLNNMSLNHKDSDVIMQELEDATGVTKHDLLTFHPGPENIRVKLRLASTRETTVPVDMAYGLFGIFGVTMPVIHGESQENALGRLFQEIVSRSGDVACIAWVGRSSEFNSAFPDHIRVYEYPSQMVPHIGEEDMERRLVNLRRTGSREDEAQAMAFYRRLNALLPARCANQLLDLPCIKFPLTTLKKVKRPDGVRAYRAGASALEDTDITTEERLLSRDQGPEDLVLVCPWIHELLDATPRYHSRRHQPSREEESLSDNDSDSESDASHLDPSLSHHAPPDHRNITLEALKLVVRFRQPLGALLLLAQGHRRYRRVATDHDIVIRVRDEVSLADMIVQTIDII